MKIVFETIKIEGKTRLISMNKLFLIILFLTTIISCSSYIPLTRMLVEEKKLTSDDLKHLQFYSYEYEIKYKGADVRKTSEGIKEGELFSGEQIERNFIIIPERTAGAAYKVETDEQGLPRKIHVLYDKDLPSIAYSLLWSTLDDPYAAYILADNELSINNDIYKNKKGLDSKLYVNKDELKKLIENKKFAKGVKVYDTKLRESEETLDD